MIDLGSIAGLHERQHQLAAYCPPCNRWAVLDRAKTVREGYGKVRRACIIASGIALLPVTPS